MFCPQCATPNGTDVKFCRSCGAELEAVALALGGKPAKPAREGADRGEPKTALYWMEKRIESTGRVTRGAILLSVSLLIGAALALFLPASFEAPWILLWMVFFGWVAVWGGIEMAYGVGGLLESKSRLRLLGPAVREETAGVNTQLLAGAEPPAVANRPAFRPSPPPSVTEGATRQLDDYAGK